MEVLKRAAESRRNARLNPDAEGEEEAAGDSDVSRDERAVVRSQLTVHEEKPVRKIFISSTAAEPGQARQLPWVIRSNVTPNKSWCVVRFSSTTPYRSSAKLPVGNMRMTSTPASSLVFSMTFKA